MERPTLDQYFINIAEVVSTRAACLKKHYGAVIVKDKYIVSTGYNAPPSGEPHCKECHKKLPGKDMSTYTDCVSTHAEMNAIILASRPEMVGATLYLAGYDVEKDEWIDAKPCEICMRMIKNAGIAKVINRSGVIYDKTEEDARINIRGRLSDISYAVINTIEKYKNSRGNIDE